MSAKIHTTNVSNVLVYNFFFPYILPIWSIFSLPFCFCSFVHFTKWNFHISINNRICWKCIFSKNIAYAISRHYGLANPEEFLWLRNILNNSWTTKWRRRRRRQQQWRNKNMENWYWIFEKKRNNNYNKKMLMKSIFYELSKKNSRVFFLVLESWETMVFRWNNDTINFFSFISFMSCVCVRV